MTQIEPTVTQIEPTVTQVEPAVTQTGSDHVTRRGMRHRSHHRRAGHASSTALASAHAAPTM
jgi:hypothetical protein